MTKIIDSERPFIENAYEQIKAANLQPEEFKFISFVVKQPHSDRFLIDIRKKGYAISYLWAQGMPSKAKRFTRLKQAQRLVAQIDNGACAEMLFENDSQFLSLTALK